MLFYIYHHLLLDSPALLGSGDHDQRRLRQSKHPNASSGEGRRTHQHPDHALHRDPVGTNDLIRRRIRCSQLDIHDRRCATVYRLLLVRLQANQSARSPSRNEPIQVLTAVPRAVLCACDGRRRNRLAIR